MLQAKNLSKSYKGRQVVQDVSFAVQRGQVVGLLGPNGAGKTTCFYMVVGSIADHGGQVLLDGRDLTRQPIHVRARAGLGYLPQEASVFRKLSVQDNLLAVLQTQREMSAAARRQRAAALMAEFRIEHLAGALGQSLSGGERRRVEIARALAMEPSFILLDEPFAGVDPISVTDLKAIIGQLRRRWIGVLITDHNVRETLDICENAYIVNAGEIIAEGEPASILQNEQVKQVYLGQHFRI